MCRICSKCWWGAKLCDQPQKTPRHRPIVTTFRIFVNSQLQHWRFSYIFHGSREADSGVLHGGRLVDGKLMSHWQWWGQTTLAEGIEFQPFEINLNFNLNFHQEGVVLALWTINSWRRAFQELSYDTNPVAVSLIVFWRYDHLTTPTPILHSIAQSAWYVNG